MKVFISWSGTTSRALAEALREWLPNVIQAVEPWMSASDIDKGARWSADIASQLAETDFGIICLTSDNLEAPWILFEAGALSKTLQKTFVCPYLFDLEPSAIRGPLVQFQATKAELEDTRRMIHTINSASGVKALPENQVNKAFEVWWPEFERRLNSIELPNAEAKPQRSDREILEELLELVRTQTRDLAHSVEEGFSDIRALAEFKVGARLRHAKHGVGVIMQVEGIGDEQILTVNFPGHGRKRIKAIHAPIERI